MAGLSSAAASAPKGFAPNSGRIISAVFFGTPEPAVTVISALVTAGYRMVAVVTQPDRPAGRRAELHAPPVKLYAQRLDIPVLQPERAVDLPRFLRPFPATVGVLYSYGKILPAAVLDHFPAGILNLHPSWLPRYRGPSPVQQAILDGVPETGVTIIRLDEQLDHGPILAQVRVGIPADATAPQLTAQLVAAGTRALIAALPRYLDGTLVPMPQPNAGATYTAVIRRDHGRVSWQNSAEGIYRCFRALQPWPGVFTSWGGRRLKLLAFHPGLATTVPLPPGVVGWQGAAVAVGCRRGVVRLQAVQLESGTVQPIDAFVRGHPTFVGSRLG